MHATPPDHDCEHLDDCVIQTSRRKFLRDSVLTVASALVAVGMTQACAAAMPLEFASATKKTGGIVRYAIPTVDGAQIDTANDVILVRWLNTVYAFNLSCPHQNTALRWERDDHEFKCPKHHSEFTPDGVYVAHSGRATRNMDRLAISRVGEAILVDTDRLYQEDLNGAQWVAAVIKL